MAADENVKQIKNRLLVGLVFLWCMACTALAKDEHPMKIWAEVTVSDHLHDEVTGKQNEEGFLALRYSIYLKNTGGSVLRMPTKGYRRMGGADEKSITERLEWELMEGGGGQKLIQPESDFAFVELRPGEQAVIRWDGMEFRRERLKSIVVQLYVPRDFGERYRFWSGDWSGTAKVRNLSDSSEGSN